MWGIANHLTPVTSHQLFPLSGISSVVWLAGSGFYQISPKERSPWKPPQAEWSSAPGLLLASASWSQSAWHMHACHLFCVHLSGLCLGKEGSCPIHLSFLGFITVLVLGTGLKMVAKWMAWTCQSNTFYLYSGAASIYKERRRAERQRLSSSASGGEIPRRGTEQRGDKPLRGGRDPGFPWFSVFPAGDTVGGKWGF